VIENKLLRKVFIPNMVEQLGYFMVAHFGFFADHLVFYVLVKVSLCMPSRHVG
jgi:hypothetical protein